MSKTKRGFLNSREGMAAYKWRVGKWDSSLTLTDCTRQINLEFGGNKSKRQSLAKLDRLIKILYEFRDAIEAQEPPKDDD